MELVIGKTELNPELHLLCGKLQKDFSELKNFVEVHTSSLNHLRGFKPEDLDSSIRDHVTQMKHSISTNVSKLGDIDGQIMDFKS